MKKTLLAIVCALFATTASAAIVGSSHDMNRFLGVVGLPSCAFCHMPHNASTAFGAPLWARNITYAITYSQYTSAQAGAATFNGVAGYNGGTRVCMSCHDGTVAVAEVLNANGVGSQNLAGGNNRSLTSVASYALVGTDLRNDHPVSVTWNGAANNPGGLAATMPTYFGTTTTVECTSCHNAHTDNLATVNSSYPGRQFMVSYQGDFCGACHTLK